MGEHVFDMIAQHGLLVSGTPAGSLSVRY